MTGPGGHDLDDTMVGVCQGVAMVAATLADRRGTTWKEELRVAAALYLAHVEQHYPAVYTHVLCVHRAGGLGGRRREAPAQEGV